MTEAVDGSPNYTYTLNTPVAVPNAPSDLTAAASTTGIDLSWTDNSTDGKKMDVLRSEDVGGNSSRQR